MLVAKFCPLSFIFNNNNLAINNNTQIQPTGAKMATESTAVAYLFYCRDFVTV